MPPRSIDDRGALERPLWTRRTWLCRAAGLAGATAFGFGRSSSAAPFALPNATDDPIAHPNDDAPPDDSPFEPRLHLRPKSFVAGDAHPFFHDGLWHLFFLGDRFEVHRALSTDLLHWRLDDPIHVDREQGAEIAPYFVLGIVRDERAGCFRTWYGRRGTMVAQESDDLKHWRRSEASYDIAPQSRYAQQRDPYVMWNSDEACWWCVMTCKVAGMPDEISGAVAFASSVDLRDWTPRGDLYHPGNVGAPEVPQLEKIGDRWYLFASFLSPRRVGPTSVLIAERCTGPWTSPDPPTLDGEDLAAMNWGTDGRRRIGIGWIPDHDLETHGRDTWGGAFGLPRELVTLDDGRLGTTLPDEIAAAIVGETLDEPSASEAQLPTGWHREGSSIVATREGAIATSHRARAGIVDVGFAHRRGTIELRWIDASERIVLTLAYAERRWLFRARREVEGAARMIELASLGEGTFLGHSKDDRSGGDGVPRRCRIVFERDIAEAFIDGRRSLAARLPHDLDDCRVEVVADDAADGAAIDLRIDSFVLRRLVSPRR